MKNRDDDKKNHNNENNNKKDDNNTIFSSKKKKKKKSLRETIEEANDIMNMDEHQIHAKSTDRKPPKN